jgi:hypothetical protein
MFKYIIVRVDFTFYMELNKMEGKDENIQHIQGQ